MSQRVHAGAKTAADHKSRVSTRDCICVALYTHKLCNGVQDQNMPSCPHAIYPVAFQTLHVDTLFAAQQPIWSNCCILGIINAASSKQPAKIRQFRHILHMEYGLSSELRRCVY